MRPRKSGADGHGRLCTRNPKQQRLPGVFNRLFDGAWLGSIIICGLISMATPVLAQQQPTASADGQSAPAILTGSVRVGMEYDGNPLRLQTDDPRLNSDDPDLAYLDDRPDVLARYFATLQSNHRVGDRGEARLQVRHGGKFYRRTTAADTLITQVLMAYRRRLGQTLSLVFDGDIKDRTERRSRLDYNRGGLRLGLRWAPGRWTVSGRAGWRYFAFKPDAALGSHGPQVDARVRRYFGGSWAGEISYSLVRRRFDASAFESIGAAGGRADTFHVGRVGLVYRGDVFVDVRYALSINRSTIDSQDLTRHGLELTVTTPLVGQFLGSARVQVQRTAVAETSNPDALFFVDDQNRNVAVLSLARPLGDQWEIEGRWSMYLEQFQANPSSLADVAVDYSRQTFVLAVGWEFQ